MVRRERESHDATHIFLTPITTMPPKRKVEDKSANARDNNITSTQRKKMRMDEARKISVQFANPKPTKTSNAATSSTYFMTIFCVITS